MRSQNFLDTDPFYSDSTTAMGLVCASKASDEYQFSIKTSRKEETLYPCFVSQSERSFTMCSNQTGSQCTRSSKYCTMRLVLGLILIVCATRNATFGGDQRECTELQPGIVKCSNSNLTEIPRALPRKTTHLDLSFNDITVIGNELAHLSNLIYLNLGNNKISLIGPEAFSNIRKLRTLNLSSNCLSDNSINNETFKHNALLQYLYLHGNKYKYSPVRQFPYLTGLQNLSVDVRKQSNFGDEFSNLTNLKYLELVSQELIQLHEDSFVNVSSLRIEYLVLRFKNHIQRMVPANYLFPFKHLKYARIQFGGYFTSIKDVLQSLNGLSGRSLEFLDLSHNYMFTKMTQELSEKDLKPLSKICVQKIDLSKNAITKFLSFVLWNSTFSKCVKEVNIAGNKFILSEYLFVLYMGNMEVIEKINVANIPLYGTEEDIKSTPHSQLFSTRIPHSEESNKKNNSTLTIRVSESLHSLNMNGVYSEYKFNPVNIKIVARNARYLNFGSMGLDFCSFVDSFEFISEKVEYFDMSGWNCANLNPEFLSSMEHFKNIRTLRTKNSRMGEGLSRDKNAKFLKGFKHLELIDLSENQLSSLHSELFSDQKSSLRQVILNKNSLESIPPTVLALENLKHIELYHNRLDYLSEDEMQMLSSRNVSIGLGGNIFQCSCDSLPSLRWISKNSPYVIGLHEILCRHQDEMLHEVIENLRDLELRCLAEKWMPISITVSIILITSILSSALGYRYRYVLLFHYLRTTRYSKAGRQNEFENDVFVSYSYVETDMTLDSSWLFNTLYPHLENVLGLKVVFDEKDFAFGEGHVNNIYDHMMKCRKIIIIMSKSFLCFKDSQCHMEMAKMHAFHRGRSSLIVIFFDDMPKEELPDSLATIWFKIDFLFWPRYNLDQEKRRLFWQQLKVFLAE